MMFEDAKYINILNLVLEGKTYNEIKKLEGVNKNTVTNLTNRLKSTGSVIPSKRRKSIYDPTIKEIQNEILALLKSNRFSYNIYKRTSLTVDEIYLILLSKGYDISKTKTRELVRYCKNVIKDSYLSIVHTPGETVEFDWGSINLHIGKSNKATKVCLAVFSFPYSNYKKVYVLKNSSSQAFVSAFKQFIADVNGVPKLLVLDNMRIARKFSSKLDSNIKLTSLFEDLCKHYNFNVRFCSPYCPNEKGNVENNVGIIKNEFKKSYINYFDNIEQVQEFVTERVDSLNKRDHPRKNDTCETLLNHEKNMLLPLPKNDYVYYHEKYSKVFNTGMIRLNNNYYSVPEMFKGEKVFVKYNDKKIYICTKDRKEVIATYTPSKSKGKRKYRVWYMLHKLKKKSNAFLNSEEYRSMPKYLKLLLEKIFNNQSDEFLNFLSLLKDKSKDLLKKFIYQFQNDLEFISIAELMILLL